MKLYWAVKEKMPLSWCIIKRLVDLKYSTSSVAIIAEVMVSLSQMVGLGGF